MPTRRFFLRNSAIALASASASSWGGARVLRATNIARPRRKVLVAILQRGAADGLNMVVPHGERAYYSLRPTIAIPRPTRDARRSADAAIDLDGFFGLHHSLGPLKALYDQRHLAIVQAVGSPHPTRSHFDAQDYMESGIPGRRACEGCWIDRALAAGSRPYAPAEGGGYPTGAFGRSLQQIAHSIKEDSGVEIAVAEIGGWDHHVNERDLLAETLREFGQGLSAFWENLGDRMENVVVVTMSEFGRTARENGNRGTDHGRANTMMVMGGAVRGGKMYGRWPGLEREQLHENRDLAMTTDFRDVLGELVYAHLGNRSLQAVFPGYTPQMLGLV